MLILTRRPGESIVFTLPSGDVVRVVVLERPGGRRGARLGVAAPPAVPVDRSEVSARKQAEAAPPAGARP